MCAINPKRQTGFIISVYTSIDMPGDEFLNLVMEKILEAEQMLNADMRLRWHVQNCPSAEDVK